VNKASSHNNDGGGGGGAISEGSSENYSLTNSNNSNDNTAHPLSSSSGESTFTLQVHPDDPLHSLSTKIESVTGLPPNEQRLIYRGRIISVPPPPPPQEDEEPNTENDKVENPTTTAAASSSPSTTIQDINGLSDGETIHLVPRIAATVTPSSSSISGTSSSFSSTNAIAANFGNLGSNNNSNNNNYENDDGSLANALLGGLLTGFTDNANTFTTTTTTTANTNVNNGVDNILSGGMIFASSSSSSGPNSGGGGGGVTSLSGSEGMNLLAALLGLGSVATNNINNNSGAAAARSSTSSSMMGTVGNNISNNHQQQGRGGGAGAVAGSTQGLGGIVSRAAMMGVIDDDNTNASDTLSSTMNDLVRASALRTAAGIGATTTQSNATPIGLLNRSADEIRSSRNAAATAAAASNTTTVANLLNQSTTLNSSSRNNNNNANGNESSIRAARNRRRATAARLTASDLQTPDPGSMEPVRQGLMTLHTLLGNAELGLNEHRQRRRMQRRQHQDRLQQDEEDGEEKGGEDDVTDHCMEQQQHHHHHHDYHPLNSHRQWYRGQWLDALDTVNQWLEATIVDIVLPSDLLGNYAVSRSSNIGDESRRRRMYNTYTSSQQRQRPVEAVVSGNDLEGRRRLLLEPRPASDTGNADFLNTNDASMGVYDLLNEGYRPRDDNDGVQLLLIHYNGWPHRWDEWIRSDSPRIRPFRTRTRHNIMSSHASPTPQAVFQAAPSTFIRDESDEVERALLLPELQRVISSVNDVLTSVLPPEEGEGRSSASSFVGNDSSAIDSSHLPWRLPNHGSEYFQSPANGDDDDSIISDDGYYNTSLSSSLRRQRQRPDPRSQLNAAQLRQLAPLIDRLGRTLTDAAPHIAALADALPRPSLPQARPVPRTDQTENGSESFAAHASRLYFGIDVEDNTEGRDESTISTVTANNAQMVEVEITIDPDLTDFINGMVNTTRGGSPRDTNREPISSSLLASYLSSLGAGGALATGGRGGGDNNDTPGVVRVVGGDGGLFGAGGGGGSGPGIDIHIHAIVTGPGMPPGGLGALIGGAAGGGTPISRSNVPNVGASVVATSEQQQSSGGIDGDETDLFSDLYSESPPPVNLHQSQRNNDAINENRDSLSQIFDECRSIEEESDSSVDSAATQPFDSKVVASTDEDAVPVVEEETILDDSEVVNESNDTGNHGLAIETAPSPDTLPSPPDASRRHSSASFGSRMYRRTFGRLSGPSRRFSGS